MEVSGQLDAPTALLLEEKHPPEAGWAPKAVLDAAE
jgi:hypothetical protein